MLCIVSHPLLDILQCIWARKKWVPKTENWVKYFLILSGTFLWISHKYSIMTMNGDCQVSKCQSRLKGLLKRSIILIHQVQSLLIAFVWWSTRLSNELQNLFGFIQKWHKCKLASCVSMIKLMISYFIWVTAEHWFVHIACRNMTLELDGWLLVHESF